MNELSYPSHLPDVCALPRWLDGYRRLEGRLVRTDGVHKRVSEPVGLPVE